MSDLKRFTLEDYDTGELNLLRMERNHIKKVYELCKGKKTATALVLGIEEKTLFNKIFRHQLEEELNCNWVGVNKNN
jgi:DNA-binding protein Fis